MTPPHRPGLLVLHGNRLELLAEAVLSWLADNPLPPLHEEVLLVPSNGMAEWLKMAMARRLGVCAATRVELPARFLWRAYRAVLGRAAVPAVLPLDKEPLAWRLMTLLPACAAEPVFAPVQRFLAQGRQGLADDSLRRWQLASRLADLFDQYQVYRADWLHDWARGQDELRRGSGARVPVPQGQRWQPALWRALLATLTAAEQQATRPLLQQRFVQALTEEGGAQAQGKDQGGFVQALPQRLVLFGSTHLPQQTLEALVAVSSRLQVLMAVPNPSRYHWADTVAGRELLPAAARRQPWRGGRSLDAVPEAELHVHGHPLLAAWGRQGRDFVRLLDAFDNQQPDGARFGPARVDLFDDGPADHEPSTLLQHLQADIRELLPLAELPPRTHRPGDGSLVFHVAHSAMREVEVLHDQLLQLLAQPPTAGSVPLAPRDIVVMVPDIDSFAPAIQAVFGQYTRGDPRHIPWGLADVSSRGRHPLLVALEWLLRAPVQRFVFSELRGLLELPALARRFALQPADVDTLLAWAAGAGVHWGLHAAQRTQLDLAACGDANTWHFGLQRLLLGYATGTLADGDGVEGDGDGSDGPTVEPHAEVAGLDAGLAGVLSELLRHLGAWWADASQARTPDAWGDVLRSLLQTLFDAGSDDDKAVLAALDDTLGQWLQACTAAAFAEPLPLDVVREAWLAAVDGPAGGAAAGRRFRAAGVTFCTLLPLRAVPFEVVCLLGMNEGDYPRPTRRNDFDLMAEAGQARAGDRSRRGDDRQLMLDALLAARRVLHVSWVGRSVRDNQPQPPSVLVAQLRDHLAAGWGPQVLPALTTEHPLQPFSRRYAEVGSPLFSYASEWRSVPVQETMQGTAPASAQGTSPASAPRAVTLDVLSRFLHNPVKAFFRQRLRVVFDEGPAPDLDDEPFVLAGLARWQHLDEILQQAQARPLPHDDSTLQRWLQHQVARQARSGSLPLGGPGAWVSDELVHTVWPMLQHWRTLQAESSHWRAAQPVCWGALQDHLPPLQTTADGAAPRWLHLQAGRVGSGAMRQKPKPRADVLLLPWLRSLAAAASGVLMQGVIVGRDGLLQVNAMQVNTQADATTPLADLLQVLQLVQDGLAGSEPLPTALRTGLAWLGAGDEAGDDDAARQAYEGSDFGGPPGEGSEACLTRLYPRYADLRAAPGFEAATRRLYTAYRDWLATHVSLHALPGSTMEAGDGG